MNTEFLENFDTFDLTQTCSGSRLHLSISGILGCPPTWMSQEVSKWLVSGLLHLLKMWGMLGL